MPVIAYTLVSDGPSDRCLTPIIDWAVAKVCAHRTVQITKQIAEHAVIHRLGRGLTEKLAETVRHFPANIYFVHRDAENQSHDARLTEIQDAALALNVDSVCPIVPVRMTEAWLLIDEAAIRRAADNPNGRTQLELPALRRLQDVVDPKDLLCKLLEQASEKQGRRLKQFRRQLPARCGRVADLIGDFSVLESVSAFSAFLHSTEEAIASIL